MGLGFQAGKVGATSLPLHQQPMTFDHRVEVSEVVGTVVGLAEIDFGDGYGAPFFAAGERAAALIVNGGIHPAVIVIHEGAADDEDVILAAASMVNSMLSPPHGPLRFHTECSM